MKNIVFFLLLISFYSASCQDPVRLDGVWLVKSVKVGEEEMTPNERWMRFNPDGTQQSGNGWLQHSIGTWEYDAVKSELNITNTNGIEDPFGPFSIDVEPASMRWTRLEEGQEVTVNLERIDVIPPTLGDRLIGLWQVVESVGHDNYFSSPQDTNDYLFFRWDKRFVMSGDEGRLMGVFNVNGHKPEIELFPYNDQLNRSTWKILQDGDRLRLDKIDAHGTVYKSYIRVREFPK